MPGDGVRTSPVHGWLGYCWLISFWGVMLFSDSGYAGDVCSLCFFIYSDACTLTVLFVISLHFYLVASYICHSILPVAYHFLYPVIMPD